MNDNYNKLFIGFLLVMLDINIGSLDILPDVIGYLLVFYGLRELYSKTEVKSFGVARIFSVWMVLIAVFEIVSGTFGLIHLGAFPSYAVMISGGLGELLLVVSIYHGMTAHMSLLDENVLALRFGNENKRYAVIQGLSLIAMSFSLNMIKDNSGIYLMALLAVSIIMHIRLLMNLSSAKKLFETEEPDVMGE